MNNSDIKILIVEDDTYLGELYHRVFSEDGFNVTLAIDGEEGELAAQTKPDLILLDVMLPKQNGIKLLKKLKKNPITADIPVIMITNLGQTSILKETVEYGAHHYIIKLKTEPYELLNHVKKFLKTSQE